MKITVAVRLYPSPEQNVILAKTLELCNVAANTVSVAAYEANVKAKGKLQKLCYETIREMNLSAQPALHVIRKVAASYATLRANIRAGNLGGKEDKRRIKAESKPIVFRQESSQPYDDRCLSWQLTDKTVSIWSISGRLRISFKCSDTQLLTLHNYRKGESDLVFRDGMWFLHTTCNIPDVETYAPQGFLGVDLGINNIATTSNGKRFSGKGLKRVRLRNQKLRAKLQKLGTRSAKRLLKKRSRKEQRFATNVNHVISKRIVTTAQRTEQGISLEKLTGIRDRVRLRKPQRVMLNSWSFAQLATFITYKAAMRGIPVVYVDPAYTSQECSKCHHVSKKNRPNQATFICTSCGFAEHADVNASNNISSRGAASWAGVT